MRSTIHIVSPRDYWRFAAGIGPSRREWWLRTWGRHEPPADLDFVERELETALAGRTWHRKRDRRAAPGEERDDLVGRLGAARPRAAVGYLGAATRGPVPPRSASGSSRAE